MAAPPPPAAPADDIAVTGEARAASARQRLAQPTHWLHRSWWRGWRSRVLVIVALALALVALIQVQRVAGEPQAAAQWRADDAGRLVLQAAPDPALRPYRGQPVLALLGPDGRRQPLDALLLHADDRWLPDGTARASQRAQHRAWRAALARGGVTLELADGTQATLPVQPRGLAGLGPGFWLLGAAALVLALAGTAAVLAQPLGAATAARVAPFLVLAWAQAVQLLGHAAAAVPGPTAALGASSGLGALHAGLDLVTAAAVVHGAALHPRAHRHAGAITAAAWALAGALIVASANGATAGGWWATQTAVLALGGAAVALLHAGRQRPVHPLGQVLQRLTLVALASFLLLAVTAVALRAAPGAALALPQVAAPAWHLLVAALLLSLPLLPRTRAPLRHLALVAGVVATAVCFDALLRGSTGLTPAAAMAAAVALAVMVLLALQPWLRAPLAGLRPAQAERLFDHLLRAARDTEDDPQLASQSLRTLLEQVFEPAEVSYTRHTPRATRIFGAGSTLVVPLAARAGQHRPPGAIVLRYAQQGRRLFGADDARLADRAAAQLQRATRYGDAVELGRSEERTRLAQDLHDDIGARLLTLMYRASDPQVEDYLRQTLKDLKTLTRGLAAGSRRLSDAAAEWKSDLGQRLEAAHCTLRWSLAADADPELGVVPWSALTRLLRELVSNVIAHAGATLVEVELGVERGRLTLVVADDGHGSDPAGWSPGLGVSGVRKRVRQLGGQVAWAQRSPHGIVCRVELRLPAA
jgi:signal transduction histidine kinase